MGSLASAQGCCRSIGPLFPEFLHSLRFSSSVPSVFQVYGFDFVFWPRLAALCYTISFNEIRRQTMLLSKEYVGYLARQMTQKLISGEFIETKNVAAITEAMNRALLDELQLEDRINDEVRLILEAYQDEMSKAGASYQEMFKKVKGELVRKYKAVL